MAPSLKYGLDQLDIGPVRAVARVADICRPRCGLNGLIQCLLRSPQGSLLSLAYHPNTMAMIARWTTPTVPTRLGKVQMAGSSSNSTSGSPIMDKATDFPVQRLVLSSSSSPRHPTRLPPSSSESHAGLCLEPINRNPASGMARQQNLSSACSTGGVSLGGLLRNQNTVTSLSTTFGSTTS